MTLLSTSEIVDRIESDFREFEKLMIASDSVTVVHRALEIVTKEEAKELLTRQEYIESLPSEAIEYFSDFSVDPLEDIWQASLKHPTIDLSPEVLDKIIRSSIQTEIGLIRRLDHIEKDTFPDNKRERLSIDERAHG